MILETLSYQRLEDEHATHVITRCQDAQCPSCGAPYRAGLAVCEYCRQPVKPLDERP